MGRPLIYLDANVVIRLVEGDAATLAPLAPALGVPRSVVTSRLSRLERRSKPLRAGDRANLAQYDASFDAEAFDKATAGVSASGTAPDAAVRSIEELWDQLRAML